MMLTTLLSFVFFFQQVDTSEHKHVSGIQLVQTVQDLTIWNNHYSDSSRYFYNINDWSDVAAKLTGGTIYKIHGFGTPTATAINGLQPNNQSVVINGFEWSDPIIGSLHPSIFLLSAIESATMTTGVSTQPITFNLTTQIKTNPEPRTQINYLDGYDKLSLFEGLFTVQASPTFSFQAGIGRKTYEPKYQNGKSDQWQFSLQTKKILSDSLTSFNVYFLTSKLLYGNYGGIDDSTLSVSTLSRYDPNQSPMMFAASTAKNNATLLQLWLDTPTSWFGVESVNHLKFNYSQLEQSILLPQSSYQTILSNNISKTNSLQFSNALDLNFKNFTFSAEAGINKNNYSMDGAYHLSEQTQDPFLQIGAQWKNKNLTLSFDAKTVQNTGRINSVSIHPYMRYQLNENIETEISVHYFRHPISLLDAVKTGRTFLSSLQESGILNEISLITSQKNSLTRLRLFHSSVETDALSLVSGRVLTNQQQIYTSLGSFVVRGVSLQNMTRVPHLLFGGDLDLETDYQFALDTQVLPKNDLRFSISHHDLWFDNSLNLWLGIEGSYRSASTQLFPDSRLGGFVYDLTRTTRPIKRIDLFARGQVSDMMLKFTYENATNEGLEYFAGYPTVISRFYFSVAWWLWN